MIKKGDLILLPMFPLEIVVYPYESLNLHIFEPRYRELIKDCLKEKINFGIPFYRHGYPLKHGTIVSFVSVAKSYGDGKMDIKTKGVRPFELKRYVKKYPGKLYPGGYIEELYWEKDGKSELRSAIRNRIEELYTFMDIPKWPEVLDKDFITFEIAHKVGFNKDQEYAFLKIISEVDRQHYMLNHLDQMIPMVKEAEEMRKKVQLNGHFKNLIPPMS